MDPFTGIHPLSMPQGRLDVEALQHVIQAGEGQDQASRVGDPGDLAGVDDSTTNSRVVIAGRIVADEQTTIHGANS